jgi:hypothetical protein
MLDRGELVDHAVGQRRSRLVFQVQIHRGVTGEDGRLRMKGGDAVMKLQHAEFRRSGGGQNDIV